MELKVFIWLTTGFILGAYGFFIVDWLNKPPHLRWELYPIKPSFWKLVLDNITFREYFKRQPAYGVSLWAWHMGFILAMFFHFLTLIHAPTLILQIAGYASFALGTVGSILVCLNRTFDPGLRLYAVPKHYITYVVTFIFFFTGALSCKYDPGLVDYQKFWFNIFNTAPVEISMLTTVHIVLFGLFMLYITTTKWIHYILRFFAHYFILWDDRPVSPKTAEKIGDLMNLRTTWNGPHLYNGSWMNEATRRLNFKEDKQDEN